MNDREPHSLRRLPLGLAVPAAVMAFILPERYENLIWLLAGLPMGLMAMVLALVFVPLALSPSDFVREITGDSRAPRTAALLIAIGSVLTTGWFLGGAVNLGWEPKRAVVPGLLLVALARLTFPFKR